MEDWNALLLLMTPLEFSAVAQTAPSVCCWSWRGREGCVLRGARQIDLDLWHAGHVLQTSRLLIVPMFLRRCVLPCILAAGVTQAFRRCVRVSPRDEPSSCSMPESYCILTSSAGQKHFHSVNGNPTLWHGGILKTCGFVDGTKVYKRPPSCIEADSTSWALTPKPATDPNALQPVETP